MANDNQPIDIRALIKENIEGLVEFKTDLVEINIAVLLGISIAAKLYREEMPSEPSSLDVLLDEACRVLDEKYPGLSKFVKG